MAVTLKDVAIAAGVSTMSVSRVLHGGGANVRVSDETAAHIRNVAKQLKYRPNILARSLRLRKTRCIGVVFENMPEFTGSLVYYNHLLEGILHAAFPHRFSVTLCSELIGETSPTALADGRFDGLLWCRDTLNDELLDVVTSIRLPIVVLHETRTGQYPDVSSVTWDNDGAARCLAQHLFATGHRQAAFVLPRRSLQNAEAQIRASAFRDEWERLGGTIPADFLLDWSEDAHEFADWYPRRGRVTALVGWNEQSAIALLDIAHKSGVSVPDALSVVSFDSTDACNTTVPPLTAVRQPLKEMGHRATEILIQKVIEPNQPVTCLSFPGTLDIRESSARPFLDEENPS